MTAIPTPPRATRLEDADTTPGPADMIRTETALLEAGVAFQTGSLALLLAEMQALATMLPHGPHPVATDAEIEAAFDNMPV